MLEEKYLFQEIKCWRYKQYCSQRLFFMIGQRPACELDCVSRMIIACSAGGIRERVFFCVWKRSHFNSLPKQKHSSEIPPATQG